MDNVIVTKTENFAVKIVYLYKKICAENEFVMSKQMLKSGTSIGANVAEAQRGQSAADFGTKMNIALKEANETLYWLKLLFKTEYICHEDYMAFERDIREIVGLLTRIVKTTFDNLQK